MGVFLIVIAILYMINEISRSLPVSSFEKNVEKLEEGMSVEEVKKLFGVPSSVSDMSGYYLIQWQNITSGGGYHLSLSFDYNFKLTKINSIYKN